MSQPRILMCPPDHYGIEYEINPWMKRESQADRGVAQEQWQDLRQILADAGAQIELLDPVPGLPDLVFTANAAMIFRRQAILARFRHPQRQGEEPHDERWLAAAGFTVRKLPPHIHFEGAGDALFCGDTLFAGYRIRSDAQGQQDVGAMIGCRVIPLELVDGYYYHLDTCFCPLGGRPGDLLSGRLRQLRPPGVGGIGGRPDRGRRARGAPLRLQRGGRRPDRGDQHRLPSAARPIAGQGLSSRSETPLDQFVKAGGSAKCLTLRLDGEEAAGWK